MSSSFEECQATFGRSVKIFNNLVFVSLLLTLGRMVWIKKVTEGKLRDEARKRGLILGSFKIVLGILLYTVLYPTCPAGCDCTSFFSSYPLLAILIGCYWVSDGMMARKRLLQETNNLNSNDSATEGFEVVACIDEEDEDNSIGSPHENVEAKMIV